MKIHHLPTGSDINAAHDAFMALPPGDALAYFRGNHVGTRSGGQIPIASHFWGLYTRGVAILTRKPTGPASDTKRVFDYLAVRKSP